MFERKIMSEVKVDRPVFMVLGNMTISCWSALGANNEVDEPSRKSGDEKE